MFFDVDLLDRIDAWIREHATSPDDWTLAGSPLTLGQAAELVMLLDLVRPGWRGGVLAGHEGNLDGGTEI